MDNNESSECQHTNADCFNSRKRDGYKYRQYKCRDCGHKWRSAEFDMPDRIHTRWNDVRREMAIDLLDLTEKQRKALDGMLELITVLSDKNE